MKEQTNLERTHEPGMRFYLGVWSFLLCIAGFEVFLAYRGFSTSTLLAGLLVLALIGAGVGLLFFMHLKFERPVMMWSIILSVVFVLLMMNQIWPDAYRMIRVGLH